MNNNWLKIVLDKGKWYIISSFLSKGMGLILLPIYTQYLSPEDFGILGLLNSISQFLTITISLYLDAALARFYHSYDKDLKNLRLLFSSIFWFICFFGLIVIIIFIFLVISNFITYESIPLIFITLTSISVLFNQLNQLFNIYLRQSLDTKRTTTVELVNSFLSIIIAILLLSLFNMGVISRIIGSLIGICFIFVYYIHYFNSLGMLIFRINFKIIKLSLKYSLPLLPSVIGGWITTMSDKIILAKYANLDSVGLYSLAATFGSLIYVLQDAITQVTGPVSMSGLLKDKTQTLVNISKISVIIFGIMISANFALTLFSKEIILIFSGEKFSEAANLIGACGFVYVISSQTRMYNIILSYHEKTFLISFSGIIMSLFSLMLNIIFIPVFGSTAAAYSSVGSSAIGAIWIMYWAKKIENVEIYWNHYFIILIYYFLCTTIMQSNTNMNVFSTLLKSFLILASFLLVYYMYSNLFKKNQYPV